MAVKKWFADADASITNAWRSDLTNRGTESNSGASDALEVFSLYGQVSSTGEDSSELSRIVMHFSASQIYQAIQDGELPAPTATNAPRYYLRLYNSKHAFTLPQNYSLEVRELTNTFDEGTGTDMENYRDVGATSWLYRNNTAGAKATGSITVNTAPSNIAHTFTVTINGTTVTVTPAVGSPTNTAQAIVTALQNNATINSKVDAARVNATVNITSKLPGKQYEYFLAVSQPATGIITASGDKLTGGSDFTTWASAGGDYSVAISAATQASPVEITTSANHNLASGDLVTFANFDASNWTALNSGTHTVTVTAANRFTVPVDTSAFGSPETFNTESVSKLVGTASFDIGTEDLIIDITADVKTWIDAGSTAAADAAHPGYIIKLPAATESASSSKYTKKFFARSSEFFYKRPCIEARWDASSGDDRSKLYARHPNLSNAQNAQSLCLYNSVGGTLQNFTLSDAGGTNDDQNVYVRFYRDEDMLNLASFQSYNPADESATAATEISTASPSAPNTNTGVYKANFIMNETGSQIYEKWFIATPNTLSDPTSWVVLRTGSFALKQRTFDGNNTNKDYVLDITNLKNSYTRNEIARFRLYTRLKDWSPTIYSVASKALENEIVEQVYYKIFRVVDEEVIVDYGIGTSGNNREHTKLSYDESGSYFDFDMSFLESGYMYGIKLMFIINGEKKEQPEIFKFRVD